MNTHDAHPPPQQSIRIPPMVQLMLDDKAESAVHASDTDAETMKPLSGILALQKGQEKLANMQYLELK